MANLKVGAKVFVTSPEGRFPGKIAEIEQYRIEIRTPNRYFVTGSDNCGYWLTNAKGVVVYGNVEEATIVHRRQVEEYRKIRVDYLNRYD